MKNLLCQAKYASTLARQKRRATEVFKGPSDMFSHEFRKISLVRLYGNDERKQDHCGGY